MQFNPPTRQPAPTPPAPRARRILLVLGVTEAFDALGADPTAHVHAFSHDWAQIDRARALASRWGVAHRISIHHQAALASFRRAS